MKLHLVLIHVSHNHVYALANVLDIQLSAIEVDEPYEPALKHFTVIMTK